MFIIPYTWYIHMSTVPTQPIWLYVDEYKKFIKNIIEKLKRIL